MSILGCSFRNRSPAESASRSEPSKRDAASPREYRLLTVVVLGLFACVEFQHTAAVFAHGELGALQAATLARSQLGRVDLVSIGLVGKQVRRVHDAGIDVSARGLGRKTLGNRIERRQAFEYATVTMRGQQLMFTCEQAREVMMGTSVPSAVEVRASVTAIPSK